jgi:hypothetical protein
MSAIPNFPNFSCPTTKSVSLTIIKSKIFFGAVKSVSISDKNCHYRNYFRETNHHKNFQDPTITDVGLALKVCRAITLESLNEGMNSKVV